MEKKGSIFFVTFIVIVVIGIFALVQFSSNQDLSEQGLLEGQAAEQALAPYADLIKKVVTDVLVLSTKRASYDSAANAIDSPSGYFISYGVSTMPTIEEAIDSTSSRAVPYCNQYLDDLSGEQYGSVEFKEAGSLSQIKVWVDGLNLDDGTVDDNYMISGAGGSGTGPVAVVEPTVIEVNPDQIIEIAVTANLATNLYATEFDLIYDHNVLEYVDGSIAVGDFFDISPEGGAFMDLTLDTSTPGVIKDIVILQLGDYPGVDGSGSLATLFFRAKGTAGDTTKIEITEPFFLTSNAQDVEFGLMNSKVIVVSGTPADPVYPTFGSDAEISTSYVIDDQNVKKDVPFLFSSNVQDNRYWYVYRNIRAWVDQDVLTQATCNHMPIIKGNASEDPGCFAPQLENSVVNDIMDSSMFQLQQKFDGDVQCNYNVLCREVKSEILWKAPCPKGCVVWPCLWYESNVSCAAGGCDSNVDCEKPLYYNSPPCQEELKLVNYTHEWVYGTGREVFASEITNGQYDAITYSEDHFIKFTANITCVDTKYTFLQEDPYEHLKFDFMTHIYMIRAEDPDDPPCPCAIGEGGAGGTQPEPRPKSSSSGSGSGSSPPPSPG